MSKTPTPEGTQAKADVYVVSNGSLVPTSKVYSKSNKESPAIKKPRSTPCNIGCKAWCLKYFWQGQVLSKSKAEQVDALDKNASLGQRILVRYRRPLGLALPAVLAHFIWWSVMINYNLWHLFPDKYFMTLTMILGSLVAGMTTEGGGAVAFPVMTLVLHVHPSVARDFSMMIQATGMSCATFAIFFMGVQIEWRAVIFGSLGGVVGLICGLEFIDPHLTPPLKKMGFVSLFFSFAFALFLLNRHHKRKTYVTIPQFKLWKAILLFVTGVLGGILTSFAGTGLDICCFSVLTLFFRVSEKTATPTSVVLMAWNSILGVYWRRVIMNTVSQEAWEFLAVAVQIVVIGTPFGTVLGTHFHRQVLASFVYILDTVSLILAFVLVPQTPALAGGSVGVIIFGFIFYAVMMKFGNILMDHVERSAKIKDLDVEKVSESPPYRPTDVDDRVVMVQQVRSSRL